MLEKYSEDGFLISEEPIISRNFVQQSLVGVNNLMSGVYDTGTAPPKSRWKPGDDLTRLRKINLPQISSVILRRLICLKEVGEFAHKVTGAENIQVWWSQLIYKPPEQEDFNQLNEVTCHQDSTYELDWSTDSHLFTLWIALSDVTEDSGPLQYLRGSHSLGALNRDIPYFERFKEDSEAYNPYFDPRFEEINAPMRMGQISCHHRHIYHGSGPNKNTGPRIGVALHLCADGSEVLRRNMYTENLDNLDLCPVLYGSADEAKFWML